MKFNRNLMKQTVTISNKHIGDLFCKPNLPKTAVTSVTNATSKKKNAWTSSTETMKFNGKIMKWIVTMKEIFFINTIP